MSDQITYDNKVDLQVATNIANINKVTASDMNEIKSVVNGNATTTETELTRLETDKLDIADVLNQASTDTDKPYSADYLNDKLVSVGATAPTDGRRVWFKKSKNLIKLNLITTATTYSGVTFTPNNDGTITLNGTPTRSRWVDLSNIDYGSTFFDLGEVTNTIKSLTINNYTMSAKITNEKVKVSYNSYNKFTSCYIDTDTNYNNAILQIQLEKGTTATAYEPYVKPAIYVDGVKIYEMS